jgi:hypothetical protein
MSFAPAVHYEKPGPHIPAGFPQIAPTGKLFPSLRRSPSGTDGGVRIGI